VGNGSISELGRAGLASIGGLGESTGKNLAPAGIEKKEKLLRINATLEEEKKGGEKRRLTCRPEISQVG